MVSTERIGYSPVQIILHWAIATLVVFQLIFGESMGAVMRAATHNATPSPADQQLASLHFWVGIAVLVLVGVRLAVRLVQGAPPTVGLSPLAVRAAQVAHSLFYLLLILVPEAAAPGGNLLERLGLRPIGIPR